MEFFQVNFEKESMNGKNSGKTTSGERVVPGKWVKVRELFLPDYFSSFTPLHFPSFFVSLHNSRVLLWTQQERKFSRIVECARGKSEKWKLCLWEGFSLHRIFLQTDFSSCLSGFHSKIFFYFKINVFLSSIFPIFGA